MTFFHELKRRNVFKVAASYAVVAWIVLQVADTTFPALNIPAWVLSLLTVLFLLGFPLALFLSWAYEMTPEGIKPTLEVPADNSIRAHTGQKLNVLMSVGLAALLVLVGLDMFVLDEAPAIVETASADAVPPAQQLPVSAALAKSIAVLPFENLSSDPEQDYFADGLAEELLNKLAQVRDLQVAGRTSSFSFKDSGADLPTISATLGVAHILNGSVRKAGNEVRVVAQLVKVDGGLVLWSHTFEEQLDDIFAIQDEIAAEVTKALSITMGAGEFSRPGMTRNIEAYDAYLQALKKLHEFSGSNSIREAIDQAERAVALDGDFAQAWMLLTDVYGRSGQFLTAEQRAGFPQRIAEARAAARRVAPDLPELQVIDAQAAAGAGKFVDAETLLLDFLQGAGNSSAAGAREYGNLLALVGRREEALRYLQQARRLDPLDARNSFVLIQIYMALGRFDEAEAEINRGLALEGLDQFIAGQRMLLGFQLNDPQRTRRELEAMEVQVPLNNTLADLWIAGDAGTALAEIRTRVALPGATGVIYTMGSQWAARLGDPQLSLELRNGKGETAAYITGPRRDLTGLWLPYYSEVRKLPAFREWMREVGFVDYWRTTGNWPDLCRPVNDDFECF